MLVKIQRYTVIRKKGVMEIFVVDGFKKRHLMINQLAFMVLDPIRTFINRRGDRIAVQ